MKLVFLGTSAGSPTKLRNVTSVALQWVQSGKLWLFDCGEGTQQQFLRAPIHLSRLEYIFISHMHGDHVFGLPGLMASRSSSIGAESPLTIYGPPQLKEFLETSLSLTHTRIKYPWEVRQIAEGQLFEDDICSVQCRQLNHGIPSFGYAIVGKQQSGEFLPDKAKSLGVVPGPSYGILKAGGKIVLPDGRTVFGADLVGPARPGRKVVICGDTGVTPATIELARDADILVHEATFMKDNVERAISVGHSTTVQAAQAAADAGVGRLILTHFSPRYEQENSNMMGDLLKEAQSVFPNTILAEDFLTEEISPKKSLDSDLQ